LCVVIYINTLLFSLFRFVAYPFSKFVGVPDIKRKIAEPNKILEKVFTTISKSPDADRIGGLARELQWTQKQVRQWFYLKRSANKPTTMKKSTECW
jgi:ceramide synthetase